MMATGGKEPIDVNKMKNQKINVNTRIVNRLNSNDPLVAGSATGSSIMQNVIASESRRRKCPSKYGDFEMNASNKANNAPNTTSFYNSC